MIVRMKVMNVNIGELRANEEALREQTVLMARNLKTGLIRTRILTSIFSETIIDRAKRFAPMKTTIQDEQVG